MHRFLLLTALLTLGATTRGATLDAPKLRPFLEAHCTECHDPDTKKGDLDLTTLSHDLEDPRTFAQWVKVHDRVRAAEMPPAKKPRPKPADIDAAMSALSTSLTSADKQRQSRDGRSVLRRMSRVEYENTLRDLLSLDGIRLKETLPEDGKSHGFDRLSAALDLSFVHVEAYLAVADKALNAALCPLVDKPPVFKARYDPLTDPILAAALSRKEAIGLIGMKRDPNIRGEYPKIVDEEPKSTAIAVFRHEDADHRYSMRSIAPVLSGVHKIRVSGYSVGWSGTEIVPTDRSAAVSIGVHSKGEHYGTVGLPPNVSAVRELTAWLERGGGMTHGTDDNLRFNPASCEGIRDFYNAKDPKKKDWNGPPVPAPGVAIEWVEIEGPFHDQWPPRSHVALFGDLPVKEWTEKSGVPKPVQQAWNQGNAHANPKDIYGERGQKRQMVYVESKDPAKDADRLFRAFLRRALRRPVTDADVAGYASQVTQRVTDGAAFQDAMLAVYRQVLVSPEFMFLREPAGKLDDHALAARLSYFLWSSMPDDALMSAANKGELARPEILRAQTERMLKDPKAARFTENFTGQWLALREINATQPDKKLYPEFMPLIQESMVLETRAFFDELLKNDLPASNIVKSDFLMLNQPLARYYNVDAPGATGWDMRRVPLPSGSKRGGFLTQGSVLKVTAAGTTTSPVKRGVFVMQKLLGITPTPPPPDAGAIEPDVRGATTVREQLDKHRRGASCAACHQKMDGYGFALESFDVTGGLRDQYRAVGAEGKDDGTRIHNHRREYHYALPVDCTGQMPDGRPFNDVDELRDLLTADPKVLAKAFTTQLLTYATGAEPTFADRAAIDAIVDRTTPTHYGLRSILHEIVQSEMFRSK